MKKLNGWMFFALLMLGGLTLAMLLGYLLRFSAVGR